MRTLTRLAIPLTIFISFLYGNDIEKKELSILDDPEKYAIKKVQEKIEEWNKSKSGISANIGTWYMMWDQTSDASERFGNDAIKVNYEIEDSPATVAIINGNYKLISATLEYYSNEATAKNDEVSNVSLGLFAVGLIPNIDFQANYISSQFKGLIDAVRLSDNAVGSGTFETDLNIWDFVIYPFNKYVGIGYRNYNYEVPQDMYVVNNTTKNVVISGLANIEYDGSFIEIVIDNKKLVDKEKNYNGLVYSLSAGVGELDAISEGYEPYLTKSDAIFYDALIGYSYKTHQPDKLGWGVTLGYRYNGIETEAKPEGDYSMITEFTTEFHGPFVNIVLSY